MWDRRGSTVTAFGKDTTQSITYTFNQQGFRSNFDYVRPPKYAIFGPSLIMGIGVDVSKIATAYFQDCQNYGVAGKYTNHDILNNIRNFADSELYSTFTKLAVVWTDRDVDQLEEYYEQLIDLDMVHFFCADVLDRPRCYKFIKTLDLDASGTHPGMLTHKVFYKILCSLFDQ